MHMSVQQLLQGAAHQPYEAFLDFLTENRHPAQGVAVVEALRKKYFNDVSSLTNVAGQSDSLLGKAFFSSRRVRACFIDATKHDDAKNDTLKKLYQSLLSGLEQYNSGNAERDEAKRTKGLVLVRGALSPFMSNKKDSQPKRSDFSLWLERLICPS